MRPLARALGRHGYDPQVVSYSSFFTSAERLATEWLPRRLVALGLDGGRQMDVVTHSMGGIILRAWVRAHLPAHLGRIVMIAPPNAGSAVADHMQRAAWFRRLFGEVGRELGTGPASLARGLGPWPAAAGELGILAGDRSINPLFAHWLGEAGDGAVSLRSVPLEGMSAFRVLHHSHTALLWRRETIEETIEFLGHGRFKGA